MNTTLWSSPGTWGLAGDVPGTGSLVGVDVVLTNDMRVRLDVPVTVGALVIEPTASLIVEKDLTYRSLKVEGTIVFDSDPCKEAAYTDNPAVEMNRFPNKAGDNVDNDAVLSAELDAAGIPTIDSERHLSDAIRGMLRDQSGEVKTSVIGVLHGWEFKRAWCYWVAKGPGIEVQTAEKLHAAHGKSVRVDGHCASPSPREWFQGLACGHYHVDDAEGLRALADTIKFLVEKAKYERTPS